MSKLIQYVYHVTKPNPTLMVRGSEPWERSYDLEARNDLNAIQKLTGLLPSLHPEGEPEVRVVMKRGKRIVAVLNYAPTT